MTTTTKIPLKHIALLFTILFLIQCPVAAIVNQDGSVEYQPDKQEIQYDIALPADTPKYQADEIQHNIQQNAQDRIKINQNTRDVFDTQNPSEQQTQDSTNDWIHIQSSAESDTFAYNHPLSKTESLEKSTQESITDSLVKNTANTYNSKNSIQKENPPEINTQESWINTINILLIIIVIILIIAIVGITWYCCTKSDADANVRQAFSKYREAFNEFREAHTEYIRARTKVTHANTEVAQARTKVTQKDANLREARTELRHALNEFRHTNTEVAQSVQPSEPLISNPNIHILNEPDC